MRTSLNNIRQAEQYLHGTLHPAEALVFQARMLLSAPLRRDVAALRRVFALLQYRQRAAMKETVGRVHARVFADPTKAAFRQSILSQF